MGQEKGYIEAEYDFFNVAFLENGAWVWPEEVPEWAGGPAARKEFYAALREAWTASSDPRKRMLVAQHSGPEAWNRLLKDENEMVRAAVALAGDENVHRVLASDSSSLVRQYVADYCSPAVLRYMADHETDANILLHIAKRKDRPAQSLLVARCWKQPEFLKKIIPLLSQAEKEHLLTHEAPEVRLRVGEYGNRRQARAVLDDKDIPETQKIFVEDRLQELEEIADALTPLPLERHIEATL